MPALRSFAQRPPHSSLLLPHTLPPRPLLLLPPLSRSRFLTALVTAGREEERFSNAPLQLIQSSVKAMVPKAQRLAHITPPTRDYPTTHPKLQLELFGSLFVEIIDGESVICLLPISLTEDIEVFISMTEPAGCFPRRQVFYFSVTEVKFKCVSGGGRDFFGGEIQVCGGVGAVIALCPCRGRGR